MNSPLSFVIINSPLFLCDMTIFSEFIPPHCVMVYEVTALRISNQKANIKVEDCLS